VPPLLYARKESCGHPINIFISKFYWRPLVKLEQFYIIHMV